MNPSTIVQNTSSCASSDRTIRISSSSSSQQTRRYTRDNKFQKLDTSNIPAVLVVYVESDQSFIDQQLLPILENDGIRYDVLHCQHIEKFGQLINNRSRVLFVLSRSFSANSTLSILPAIAVRYISNEKIVCLLIDEYVKFEDNLRFLSTTRCVLYSDADWKKYLLRHIRIRNPSFVQMIDPRSVSQCLQHHGLDIRHMAFDIYGLFVELDNSTLHVNVETFRKHMLEHESSGTHLVCADCSLMRTPNTTIRLIFENSFKLSDDIGTFDKIMTHLCSNVFDILSLRQANIPLTLACTMMGRPLLDRSYIRKLWLKIVLTGFTRVIAKEQVMKCPENKNEELRFATFPSSWCFDDVPSARSLAQAGFFFCKRPHATRCFTCGLYFGTWRKDDDPVLIHAAVSKFCPFIQKILSDDCIQNAAERYIENQYKVNEMYELLQSRIMSFEEEENKLFEKERIHELSNAGFYYTGWRDVVACYACGIQLTEIAANKRVMATHTRLSPSCPFINAKKGGDYIKDILDVVGEAVPQTTVTFNLRNFDSREEKRKDMFLFASNLN